MNLWNPDVARLSCVIGVGVGALATAAYLPFSLTGERPSSHKNSKGWLLWILEDRRAWLFFMTCMGVSLLAYVAGILYRGPLPSAKNIASMFKDANGIVTIMLTLLGVVMTVVTFGVQNIAQRATQEIKQASERHDKLAKQAASEIKEAGEKYEKSLKEAKEEAAIKLVQILAKYGVIELVYKTIVLRLENEDSLKTDLHDEERKLRRVLETIYGSIDHRSFIEYLYRVSLKNKNSNYSFLNYLSDREKEYLKLLYAHFLHLSQQNEMGDSETSLPPEEARELAKKANKLLSCMPCGSA